MIYGCTVLYFFKYTYESSTVANIFIFLQSKIITIVVTHENRDCELRCCRKADVGTLEVVIRIKTSICNIYKLLWGPDLIRLEFSTQTKLVILGIIFRLITESSTQSRIFPFAPLSRAIAFL